MGVIHKSTMYIRRIEVNWVVMSMAQKICKIFYPLLDTSRPYDPPPFTAGK